MNLPELKGQVIGQYRIDKKLGAGGMGVVYQAWHTDTGREVAFKILPIAVYTPSEHIRRFLRESRTIAKLEHPHIVPFYEAGTHAINDEFQVSYMAMRLLRGGSLQDRMEKSGTIPLKDVITLTNQLVDALTYAHSKRIIHRDLKPSNIMFDENGNAVLVDFGVAKPQDAVSKLTATGQAVGTPEYMAPEQWGMEHITHAVDQYALAVVIYEMLSGHMPFEASNLAGIVGKVLTKPPEPLLRYRRDLPTSLWAVLERALAKQPDERYPSIVDFAHELETSLLAPEKATTQMPKPTKGFVEQILPGPFEWCPVDQGFVTLEDSSRQRPPGTRGGRYEVNAFSIAKYPITNTQYQVFLKTPDGYRDEKWWDYSKDARYWRQNHPYKETAFEGHDLPRTNVSWYDALAFCRWLSSRTGQHITLPTEQQWQRAAQGDENWRYPWGDNFVRGYCNAISSGIRRPTPVTQYPDGESFFGVCDMSGNVWEWCLTKWGINSTELLGEEPRIVRGGTCLNHEDDVRVTARYWSKPSDTGQYVGFRIAFIP
jgi:serine/threonine protein kinase